MPFIHELFAETQCQYFVEGRLQHGCFSCVICEIFESTFFWWASASDSFWFSKFWHITRLVFISVSFVICIYLNCFTNQTFCKFYLLFNVRNIFFTYFFTYLLPVLFFSKCLVYVFVFCLFTPFLSVLFVFHSKNLVL